MIPGLIKKHNLYTYETATGHGQRQILIKDNIFILMCRQINDHTPQKHANYGHIFVG